MLICDLRIENLHATCVCVYSYALVPASDCTHTCLALIIKGLVSCACVCVCVEIGTIVCSVVVVVHENFANVCVTEFARRRSQCS